MKFPRLRRPWLIGLCMLALLWPWADTRAQESVHLAINDVDDSQFPQVNAYLTATDSSGLPIRNLAPSVFTVSEDGQPVTSFILNELPQSSQPIAVAIGIDTSGSMASALDETQAAALAFLGSLSPNDRVSLLTFADEARVAVPLTTDRETLRNAINALRPEGETALHDALALAVDVLRDLPTGRKAIVLLADGEDNSSVFTFDVAVHQAQVWAIPVYPIGFGRATLYQPQLEMIASLTGGYAQIRPDSSTLEEAFDTILAVLRHQYSMEFTSSLPADGGEHDLTVRLVQQGTEVSATRAFTALPRDVTVELNGLADGQLVGGDVSLEPQWLAPAQLASVEYRLDGGLLATVSQSPFTFTWDSTIVEPGEHVLTVTATDQVGNQGTRDYRLEVRPPVRVTWLSPVDDAELLGMQLLSVDVDAVASIARVEYFVDGIPIDRVTTAPFEVQWSTEELEPGRHTLLAIATDMNDHAGQAAIDVALALGGSLLLPLVLGTAVLAALLIIPLGLRRRRRWGATSRPAAPTSPAMPPAASLVEVEGLHPGKEWSLGTTEVRIGRKQSDSDIVAAGRSASRRHAVVRLEEGKYVVSDVNPANPTMVNGKPIRGQHTLADGDMLQIGESVFRFRVGKEG
jgi:VWFA-related protein